MTALKNPLGIFLSVVLLLSLTVNAWFFIARQTKIPLNNALSEIQNRFDKNSIHIVELPAGDIALPASEDTHIFGLNQLSGSSLYDAVGKAMIVDLDKKNSSPIAGAAYRTQTWSGIGATTPMTSPNFKYVASMDDVGNIHVTNGKGERQVSTEAISLPKECKSVKAAGYDIESISTSWSELYLSGWSPDSTKLLYYVHIANPSIKALAEGFYLADFAQGKKQYLAGLKQFDGWFPDNRSVLSHEQETTSRKTKVFRTDITTGVQTPLGVLDDIAHSTSISPDGSAVLLVTGSADASALWEVKQGSSNAKKLLHTTSPEQFQSVSFSLDGKSAIVLRTTGSQKSNLSMLDLATMKERAIDAPVKLFRTWIDQTHALILGGSQAPWPLQTLDTNTGETENLLDHASLQ